MAIWFLNKRHVGHQQILSTLVHKPWSVCKKGLLGLESYWAQQRSFLGAISDPYAKILHSDPYGGCQKTVRSYLVLMQKRILRFTNLARSGLNPSINSLVLKQKTFTEWSIFEPWGLFLIRVLTVLLT